MPKENNNDETCETNVKITLEENLKKKNKTKLINGRLMTSRSFKVIRTEDGTTKKESN